MQTDDDAFSALHPLSTCVRFFTRGVCIFFTRSFACTTMHLVQSNTWSHPPLHAPAYAPRNPSSIFFFTSKMYNRRCIVCKRMRYTFAYAPKEWNGGSALCKEDAKNGACAKVYCMPFGGTHRRCERDQVHWYVVRRMGPLVRSEVHVFPLCFAPRFTCIEDATYAPLRCNQRSARERIGPHYLSVLLYFPCYKDYTCTPLPFYEPFGVLHAAVVWEQYNTPLHMYFRCITSPMLYALLAPKGMLQRWVKRQEQVHIIIKNFFYTGVAAEIFVWYNDIIR